MNKPVYSWDSSVFIAWLTDDQTAPLTDIGNVIEEVENDRAVLVVSVTAYSEVLAAKHTPEQMVRFRDFLKRSNVTNVDNTIVIAEKAGAIRSAGLGLSPVRKIKTPDATFLATAILYKVDALHALDKPLLNLNGLPLAEGITICKPVLFGGQKTLY